MAIRPKSWRGKNSNVILSMSFLRNKHKISPSTHLNPLVLVGLAARTSLNKRHQTEKIMTRQCFLCLMWQLFLFFIYFFLKTGLLASFPETRKTQSPLPFHFSACVLYKAIIEEWLSCRVCFRHTTLATFTHTFNKSFNKTGGIIRSFLWPVWCISSQQVLSPYLWFFLTCILILRKDV